MNNVFDILGEKKFAGSDNKNLIIPLFIESAINENHNYSSDSNINMSELYNEERIKYEQYRLSCKIEPIFNITNDDINKKVLLDKFTKFSSDEWSLGVAYPVRSLNDTQGYKKIVTLSNKEINLENGLPGIPLKIKKYLDKDRLGFNMFIGHNLEPGDSIYITSGNINLIPSGNYLVYEINGNNIYIDYTPSINYYNDKIIVNNITFNKNSEIDNIFQKDNFDFLNYVDYSFNIKKINENDTIEYYIKEVEICKTYNNINLLPFSYTIYGNNVFTLTTDQPIDLSGIKDNMNYPVNKLYLTIIKKSGNINKNISTVESHFTNISKFAISGSGINNVSLKQKDNSIDTLVKGERFLHSIVEYNPNTITENEISKINHFFNYDDTYYYYNPFSEIKIKALSSYIEESPQITTSPTYAIYNKYNEGYIWRDVLEPGYFEDGINGVNYPFANNSHYVNHDVKLYLHTNKTSKFLKKKTLLDAEESKEGYNFTTQIAATNNTNKTLNSDDC
jgi:hypothetical protein